jgi:hypothetical protein
MRKILALIIAVPFTITLIVSPAEAAPKPGHCWNSGNFNMYAGVNEDIYLEDLLNAIAIGNNFKVNRCRTQGIRIEIVQANNNNEVKALKQEVRDPEGWSTPWLYCDTSYDNTQGYLVNWLWHTKNIVAWKGEKERYIKWALTWKKKHGCISSK